MFASSMTRFNHDAFDRSSTLILIGILRVEDGNIILVNRRAGEK